jgi:phosphoserine phosphatase RsbU/P
MSSDEIPRSVSSGTASNRHPSAAQFVACPQSSPVPPAELTKLIVEVAGAFAGLAGARLWQMADGEPVVRQQSGATPPANEVIPGQRVLGQTAAGSDGSRQTHLLNGTKEILGILEVFGNGNLGAGVQSSLAKFATIASIALDHAVAQQSVHDFSAILEATKLLNSTLDLSELLRIILQLCTRLCEADRGTVFLLDRKSNEIWSVKGLGLEKREIRIPVSRGIAGWVARHGDPVRVEDALSDPHFDPGVDRDLGYHTRELLALPIRNKSGEIVGVLELLNKKNGPFSAADEKSLSHFSIYIALALENARLHRESLTKQRMESDLALARNVQRGLLPESPPALNGFDIGVAYTPSLMVGGDYYDFMRLRPDSLLAVVADVEGKGVASALMMANLQASLHALAGHVHALEAVVQSVNDILLSDTRARKLLSMFVSVIEERPRVLHYINAGHVPPAIIRHDGETAQLDEGGFVLGAFPDASYRRGRVQLRSGDVFIAYTDGVTEAMDIHGEQYGFERLVDLVRARRDEPAKQIVDIVLSEVDRFSLHGPDEDDRVVLVLKVS